MAANAASGRKPASGCRDAPLAEARSATPPRLDFCRSESLLDRVKNCSASAFLASSVGRGRAGHRVPAGVSRGPDGRREAARARHP